MPTERDAVRPVTSEGIRSVPLRVDTAAGHHLLIRHVEPADVDALVDLYASLDATSTYRRFFTATGPGREFYERLARIGERGGVCLVVVDLDASADGPVLAAEAGYELLANGNGEAAMTVAASWRGWMGPYLFDLLREQAAARGVENLELEILTCNRPMRAITRRLGEAFLAGSDWQNVRVVVSTTGDAASWRPGERPTVLVELRSIDPDALAGLAAAGYEVAACTGRRAPGQRCPMLGDGEDCPLARDADVVVIAIADEVEREHLGSLHRRRHPGVPVVEIDRHGGAFAGDLLVDAVGTALASGDRDR